MSPGQLPLPLATIAGVRAGTAIQCARHRDRTAIDDVGAAGIAMKARFAGAFG